MNVVKADHAGACFGVQRALDIALEASKSSARAHTLGPLIHNPIVVRELAEAGVDEIASVSEADPNDTVIIRSHGVTPQVMRDVESHVKNVLDATCPFVAAAQKAAYQLADAVVVIGGRNSSNTTRLASICRSACARTYHIESPDELDPLWFKGCETVGVTAGASTPESQISRVIEYLETL